MSLRAFHKFFICVAILLCGWFAVSEYNIYTSTGSKESLCIFLAVSLTGAALCLYFVWFLRKCNR